MVLSQIETMYSRGTKISVSVLDLNVVKITTTARFTLCNNPARLAFFRGLFTGKEHARGALGQNYRCDIL